MACATTCRSCRSVQARETLAGPCVIVRSERETAPSARRAAAGQEGQHDSAVVAVAPAGPSAGRGPAGPSRCRWDEVPSRIEYANVATRGMTCCSVSAAAASRSTFSCWYRRTVGMPMLNPAARRIRVSPLRGWARTSCQRSRKIDPGRVGRVDTQCPFVASSTHRRPARVPGSVHAMSASCRRPSYSPASSPPVSACAVAC